MNTAITHPLLLLPLLFAGHLSSAAQLSCQTAPQPAEYMPYFRLQAEIDKSALAGAELVALSKVSIEAASGTLAIDTLAKDAAYRPRTIKERNRFLFDIDVTSVEATPAAFSFDGIAHGVIMPKTLPVGEKDFTAYLISSTDSYHDGINSYFRTLCTLD